MRSTKARDPVYAHCTSAALQSKMTTALLVRVTTPMYEFRHLTQLCCISAELRSTKAWDLVHADFISVALQNKMRQPCLLVSPRLRVLAPDTALLHFSSDAQRQSVGPCLRSLHQCCSVKQDENSLACRCSHSYKFGTSHSSAAIQQRSAAPKPGTLFTLAAPVLLCEAR